MVTHSVAALISSSGKGSDNREGPRVACGERDEVVNCMRSGTSVARITSSSAVKKRAAISDGSNT